MRRLSFIHFDNTIKEEDRDRNLKEKLEDELQGIFIWALGGLKRLQENGYQFTEPESSRKLLSQYEKEINPMMLFFEECIVPSEESHRENNKVIYNSYKLWADANGLQGQSKISTQKFWRRFEEQCKALGYKSESRRSNDFRYHTGIRVAGEFRVEINNSHCGLRLGG